MNSEREISSNFRSARPAWRVCSVKTTPRLPSRHENEKGPLLEVRDAGVMGRGVFAVRRIGKGELVEACPVIPLSAADEKRLAGTTLDHYLFAWGEDSEGACLVLGLGSLFNHSAAPNTVACRVEAKARMEFFALRDIAAGEQVFVDYHWKKAEYHFNSGDAADAKSPSRESAPGKVRRSTAERD